MQEEIASLEAEQNRYISMVQSGRLQCAQLSTDTSSLRLAMFTRRMRHRNTLHAHVMTTNAYPVENTGTQPPIPAPVAQRSVPMLSRTHSRNSNGNGNSNGATQSDAELLMQARSSLGDGGSNNGGGVGVGVSVHTRGSASNSTASVTASGGAASGAGGGASGAGGSRSSSRLGHTAATGNKVITVVHHTLSTQSINTLYQPTLSTHSIILDASYQYTLLTYPVTTIALPQNQCKHHRHQHHHRHHQQPQQQQQQQGLPVNAVEIKTLLLPPTLPLQPTSLPRRQQLLTPIWVVITPHRVRAIPLLLLLHEDELLAVTVVPPVVQPIAPLLVLLGLSLLPPRRHHHHHWNCLHLNLNLNPTMQGLPPRTGTGQGTVQGTGQGTGQGKPKKRRKKRKKKGKKMEKTGPQRMMVKQQQKLNLIKRKRKKFEGIECVPLHTAHMRFKTLTFPLSYTEHNVTYHNIT